MLRTHLLEIKYEFLKALRTPQYAFPTLLFPILFYLFFAVLLNKHQGSGTGMSTYMLATYGTFGVIGASLFGFGVTVALERGQGWLHVKRTTPMPLSAYFIAKIAMAILFSAIIVVSLISLGLTVGGAHLSIPRAFALLGILLSGAITFSAFGLAVGYNVSANGAVPVLNLIYLPMSFLSGLWVPIWALPQGLQRFAFFLPPFHLSQLALKAIGGGRGLPTYVHVIAMVIATAVFLAIAYRGYRRDEA